MQKMARASETKGRPATSGRATLGRTTLLRDVYRSLINTGRTYAAFRDDDKATVARISDKAPILDPMSGYGGLASICAELGVKSVGVEFNPPQYFWQLLAHPQRTDLHLTAIAHLQRQRRKWPRPRKRAIVADDFFSQDLRAVLQRLLDVMLSSYSAVDSLGRSNPLESAVSLLLPFSGRLTCTSPGNVSTHTKQGGTCVLLGWQEDFDAYLNALVTRLGLIQSKSKCIDHEIYLGDARTIALGDRRFNSMFTSPPYPNHRDFTSILLPENELLTWLKELYDIRVPFNREQIVGSNFVKGEEVRQPLSRVATQFLNDAERLRRNKRAVYDDTVYYLPYFKKYFTALEDAYQNVSRYLSMSFEGYVVVVNNTHRGLVVPVAEAVQEMWEALGFRSDVFSAKESFHLGTKNPRAKGIRARHTEYVVKIWR